MSPNTSPGITVKVASEFSTDMSRRLAQWLSGLPSSDHSPHCSPFLENQPHPLPRKKGFSPTWAIFLPQFTRLEVTPSKLVARFCHRNLVWSKRL